MHYSTLNSKFFFVFVAVRKKALVIGDLRYSTTSFSVWKRTFYFFSSVFPETTYEQVLLSISFQSVLVIFDIIGSFFDAGVKL